MVDGAGDTSKEKNTGSIMNRSKTRDLPLDLGAESKASCLGDCTNAATKSSSKVEIPLTNMDGKPIHSVKDISLMEGESPTPNLINQVQSTDQDADGSEDHFLDREDASYCHEESDEGEENFYDPREEISELLQECEYPGSFACSGTCNPHMAMPGLIIDGLGSIGLPLSLTEAQALAARCDQAPFGRGDQTVIDTSVRNTKQLDPSAFQITNPKWSEYLNDVVTTVREDLGVQEELEVEAQLYKLLLYEPGSFFKPHRDSEKVDGMFGTLVIILPTFYSGGDLIVKHGTNMKCFSQTKDSAFNTQYAAFYADCQHELKEIESGHRICVVYNLVKVGGSCSRPSGKKKTTILKKLRARAAAWSKKPDMDKMVIMTDHLYTPAGMRSGGTARFKGKDAAMVKLLEMVKASDIDLDWDHGIVSFTEEGYAYGDEDAYYTCSDESFEWAETLDSTMRLVLDRYGEIGISSSWPSEMIPEDFFEDKDPEKEFYLPTGNEGVTAERQYTNSAIVVWSRSRAWEVLTEGNIGKMIKYVSSHGHMESDEWQQEKMTILSERLLRHKCSNSFRKAMIPDFVRAFENINESIARDIGVDFLQCYILDQTTRIPCELIKVLPQIISWFTNENDAKSLFVKCIKKEAYAHEPNHAISFVFDFKEAVGNETLGHAISKKLADQLVECMVPTSLETPLIATPTKKSIKDFVSMFIGDECLSDDIGTVRTFIEHVIWASCQLKKVENRYLYRGEPIIEEAKGPTILCNTGLLDCCEKFGWKTMEDVLGLAVQKMIEHGSKDIAQSLVKELKTKSNENQRSPGKNEVCSKLKKLLIDDIKSS